MKNKSQVSRFEYWAGVASICGLIVTLGGLLYTVWKDTKSDIKRVEEQIARPQFRVTYPLDGDFVEMNDLVKGWTPYSNKMIYIVITPIQTGDDFIQDTNAKIDAGGFWIARAIFGTAAVGTGQKFLIRAIATQDKLSAGPLTKKPADVIFSEGVYVTRKR